MNKRNLFQVCKDILKSENVYIQFIILVGQKGK
jgi:hypothetical protein